jgi:hypothetical protein
MSKTYQVVPSNRKTLFLRNLETILINQNIMSESKTKDFRKDSSNWILSLINDYFLDEQERTNQLMKKRFIEDSLFERFIKDRENLSLNDN